MCKLPFRLYIKISDTKQPLLSAVAWGGAGGARAPPQ